MAKSCKGLAEELVKCLNESDCVQVENRSYRECAKEKSPCISSECVGLRETYFNCKRGQVKQKKNKDVEALDIAFAFRLEVRYSPGSILTAFLRNSKKSWDAARKLVEVLKPNPAFMLFKKQLADLKSLEKCLQQRKVDPSDLLSGWHPRKRMTKIQRELAALEKKRDEKRREKLLRKRKADQLEPPKKPKNKKLNGARLSQGPEQQNCAASIGGSILFVNKLPKSSPVLNIPGPVLLPGVEPSILLSRPYRIEDALYNERFVGIGLAEPETFIG